MRTQPKLSLMLLFGLLLSGTACTRPGVTTETRPSLAAELQAWQGRSSQAFLKATGWVPSADYGIGSQGKRVVVFDALGTPGTDTTLTYTHTTPWTGPDSKYPGVTTTSGPNQPVAPAPGNSSVRTERITLPQNRPGCRLTLWVDAQGNIERWLLEGSERTHQALDRLKKS